jgi:cytochrome c5
MRKIMSLAWGASLLLATSGAGAESDRMEDGRQAYLTQCAKCHEAGLLGAPRTNHPNEWEDRSHLWEAVLLGHASKGYLNMPKPAADDYAIGVAAEYMLTITHPDLPQD